MPTFALLPLLLVLGGTARGAQWDINDLVDSLGCKDFSGALESTGLMYVLGDNNSGTSDQGEPNRNRGVMMTYRTCDM